MVNREARPGPWRTLDEIAPDLEVLRELIDGEPTRRRQYQHIHDRVTARLAAISERKKKKAITLYKCMVEGMWWYGGQSRHPILVEALCDAVGTGSKVFAGRAPCP